MTTEEAALQVWLKTTQDNPVSVGDACREIGLDESTTKQMPKILYKMRKGTLYAKSIVEKYPVKSKTPTAREGKFAVPKENVDEIRRMYATGKHTMQAIADQFGIKRDAVKYMVKDIAMVGGLPRQERPRRR